MTRIWIVIAVIGWALFADVEYRQHCRTYDVRLWAEQAYENGWFDGTNWRTISPTVRVANREFSVQAVVHAHEGAWDGAPR